MKINFRTIRSCRYIVLFILLLITNSVFAQGNYPVISQIQLYPPYSVYLEDYTSIEKERLAVTLTLNDQDWPTLDVRLKISIKGGGIEITTIDHFLGTPITLHQGVPLRITGSELTEYFNPVNLNFQGINKAEFMQNGGKLPEGILVFSVQVLEARRMVEVSNPNPMANPGGGGTAIAFPMLNNPPIWLTPTQGKVVKANDPQHVLFTWLPMHNGPFTTEYEFQIVEIWPKDNSPEIVINTLTPIHTETTRRTRLVYGPDKPMLEPGKKYACRIRAYDAGGASLFKNQGYSEVLTFTFGKPCKTPLNITHNDPGKQNATILWDAFPDNTKFIINYKEKEQNEDEWYEDEAENSPFTINKLNPGKAYEYRVKAMCGSLQSGYSLTKEFKTQELGNVEYECGNNSHIPPIDGSPELEALNVNDIITIGGFQATITKVEKGTSGFTGECTVSTYWIFPIRAKFENIRVNQSMQVTSGDIVALKTEVPENAIENEEQGTNTTNNTILEDNANIPVNDATVIAIDKDENNNVVITYSNGTSHTVLHGNTATITDKVGNVVTVDKDGNYTIVDKDGNPVDLNSGNGSSESLISKICIEDAEVAIFYTNKPEERVAKKENQEIKADNGYTFIVKDETIELKKEDKFIYPELNKEDNCYIINEMEPLMYEGDANSICFRNKEFVVNGDNSRKRTYGFNNIVIDSKGKKFIVNDVGKIKIESIIGSELVKDTEENIIPEEWEKDGKCFTLKGEYNYDHKVITSVCFNETDNKFTVHSDIGIKDYNTDAIYFIDKLAYVFKVENKELVVVKKDKFVYPVITKNGNCYEVTNVEPFDISENIKSLCIYKNGFETINENSDTTFHEGLNKIFTDKNGIKFLINPAGDVKIFDEDNKDITEEWIKTANCFSHTSEPPSEPFDEVNYDGDIDFVFKEFDRFFIKDSKGNTEPLNKFDKTLTIKYNKGEITISKDDVKAGIYLGNYLWEETNFNNRIIEKSSFPDYTAIFHNFSVWDFGNKEQQIKDLFGGKLFQDNFKVNLIFTDFLAQQNATLQNSINEYVSKMLQGSEPVIWIHLNENSSFEVKSSGIKDKNILDKIAESLNIGFSKIIEGLEMAGEGALTGINNGFDCMFTAMYHATNFASRTIRKLRIPPYYWDPNALGYSASYREIMTPILFAFEIQTIPLVAYLKTVLNENGKEEFDNIKWAYYCGLWNGIVEIGASVSDIINLLTQLVSQERTNNLVDSFYDLKRIEIEGCENRDLICILLKMFYEDHLSTDCKRAEFIGEMIPLLIIPNVNPETLGSGLAAQAFKVLKTIDEISDMFSPLKWTFSVIINGTKITFKGIKKFSVYLNKSKKYCLDVIDDNTGILQMEIVAGSKFTKKVDDIYLEQGGKEYKVLIDGGDDIAIINNWDNLTHNDLQTLFAKLLKTDIQFKNKISKSAKSVNLEFEIDYIKRITNKDGSLIDPQNFRPPYKKGSFVEEFELTKDAFFIRLYDQYRPGSWMFSIEDFYSLEKNAYKIKDVLSLPVKPQKYALVRIPSGTKMRKGTAAKIWDATYKWGKGGGTQYQIVDFNWQEMNSWFKEIGDL